MPSVNFVDDPQPDDAATRWFAGLVASTHADLYRYALRRVGTDAAADVVSDVFLAAWRRRDDIPRDAARLWLFGVARHAVANQVRTAQRHERLHVRLAAQAGEQVTEPATEPTDDGSAVRSALAALAETEQEALRLTEWEQLSVSEAAKVAGCSAGAFRVRLHRARKHLAARLTRMEESS